MTYALIALMLAAEPDAPKVVELTPTAHDARVEALTCKKDLADCQADGKVSYTWLTVGIAAGVLAGFGVGLAVGLAKK